MPCNQSQLPRTKSSRELRSGWTAIGNALSDATSPRVAANESTQPGVCPPVLGMMSVHTFNPNRSRDASPFGQDIWLLTIAMLGVRGGAMVNEYAYDSTPSAVASTR